MWFEVFLTVSGLLFFQDNVNYILFTLTIDNCRLRQRLAPPLKLQRHADVGQGLLPTLPGLRWPGTYSSFTWFFSAYFELITIYCASYVNSYVFYVFQFSLCVLTIRHSLKNHFIIENSFFSPLIPSTIFLRITMIAC